MPRILVVDDEHATRDSIAELLRAEGFDVATAADGSDALAYLRAERCDVGLILLDLMMRDVDGWSFRRRQLGDPTIASIPVVIMSGAHNVHTVAASLGAAAFVMKPVELRALISIVRRYC